MTSHSNRRIALVTGGTAGFGFALIRALIESPGKPWTVFTDGRDPRRARGLPDNLRFMAGDIGNPEHRAELAGAVQTEGRLDLLVHNASSLGPLPMSHLAALDSTALTGIWSTNVVAAHDLNRLLIPCLRASRGTLVSLSSDAAVAAYPTWGGYGATKAALDHLTLTFGEEEQIAAYAVDPGDMRTQMHQDAFPGEDISDRPDADTVPPRLLRLLAARPTSGRYRLADFA